MAGEARADAPAVIAIRLTPFCAFMARSLAAFCGGGPHSFLSCFVYHILLRYAATSPLCTMKQAFSPTSAPPPLYLLFSPHYDTGIVLNLQTSLDAHISGALILRRWFYQFDLEALQNPACGNS